MKITHVIHSIDRSKGGPSTYMQLLTGHLAQVIRRLESPTESDQSDKALAESESHRMTTNLELEVVTLKSPDPILLDQSIKYHAEPASKLGLFGYAPGFSSYFEDCDTDLFHGNGLWQYPVHTMAATARKRKIPYIISTHGMLEPWSMTQGKWKKQLAMQLFQKEDLQRANVIHCTAQMEAETIRKMGFKPPMAVIPNGIDTSTFIPTETKPENQKKKALFLSRIHHKKGLEQLIISWSLIHPNKRSGWELEIAGNGEEAYIQALNELIMEEKLGDEIRLTGPVFGQEKIKKYQEASLFVLPTHSENFGIVVAEALACEVPVITTQGTPWQELEEKNCGWWTPIGVEYIRSALEDALSRSDQELKEMGKNGRALVSEKYSINKVAEQMMELYRWVLGEGAKPEFVV